MDVVDVRAPTRVRLRNDRFLESYLHELPELPGLAGAPFGGMICRVEPGEATDPDFHNQEELFVVVTGEGKLVVGGETTEVRAGDAFALPRQVEHVIENTGREPLTFVSFWWPKVEPET
jgi:mannose-6-phosphate isomerase-like protein (cupin superfamily)